MTCDRFQPKLTTILRITKCLYPLAGIFSGLLGTKHIALHFSNSTNITMFFSPWWVLPCFFFLPVTVLSIYKVHVCVVWSVSGRWGEKREFYSQETWPNNVPENCMVDMESQFSIQIWLPVFFYLIEKTLHNRAIAVIYLPSQKCFDFEKQLQSMRWHSQHLHN